jgi:tetratricopeptide (TPR) repeat protein
MWNTFRRKKGEGRAVPPQPATPKTNRVDELVDALQRDGRIKDLERELTGLDPSTLSRAEQESWWHLYGVAAFHAGRDAEAHTRLQEAYARFPDSAVIRFSLGQQYIRAGGIRRGFELFRTCRFPEVPREYAMAQARYAYLWNLYADGLVFIRPFFEAYKRIRILDDHFLYVRGLPFFGTWWGYLAALSLLAGDLGELESVTKFVVKNCYDYDFDHLQAELAAHREGKPESLLDVLEKKLGSQPEDGFSSGYLRLNIAVIKARAAKTLYSAKSFLAGVTLTAKQDAWLEDIRTLARAEAAHRFGDPELESECVDAFMVRQPMLLEPDIALDFHLLRYQEVLKPKIKAP